MSSGAAVLRVDREFELARPVSEIQRERRVFAHLLIGRTPEELSAAFHLPVADVLAIAKRSATDVALRSVEANISASLSRHGFPSPKRTAPKQIPPAAPERCPEPAAIEERPRLAAADIVGAVAAAARESPSGLGLSQEEYSKWRAERSPAAPSVRTIRRRIGWIRAKHLAQGPRGNGGALTPPL